jgi:hypothetical protein
MNVNVREKQLFDACITRRRLRAQRAMRCQNISEFNVISRGQAANNSIKSLFTRSLLFAQKELRGERSTRRGTCRASIFDTKPSSFITTSLSGGVSSLRTSPG